MTTALLRLRPLALGLALIVAGVWSAPAAAQATPETSRSSTADTTQARASLFDANVAEGHKRRRGVRPRPTPPPARQQTPLPTRPASTYEAAVLTPGGGTTVVSVPPPRRASALPASGAEAGTPADSSRLFDSRTAWGHKPLEGRPQFFDARIAWGHKDPARREEGLFDTEVAEGHKELPVTAVTVFEVPEDAFALIDGQMRYVRGLSGTERLQARYFPAIERALERLELPTELKYVALIESRLDPQAVSHAGARGIWQIMPETAGDFGLDSMAVHDPARATPAATLYLDRLHKMFDGDWMLALAAYNAGPGRVIRARREFQRVVGRAPNFWEVRHRLPRETQDYVPRFLAAVQHFESTK
ncbi:MAG: transglycosylase SLT domain-containing protein [Bacteroidota bacterium]